MNNPFDSYGNRRAPGVQEDKRFADLYDQLDSCYECGSTSLVRRRSGIVCKDCRTLVIPNE